MPHIRRILPILFLLALLVLPGPLAADEPVVRAVLFWSDGCPHCHYVIDEVLPPIQEGYGEQFQLKLLQVEHPANQLLYQRAVETYHIPPERYGVPCLIIGNRVLVGSQEIPDRLGTEIERWLAAGGVDYPALPGLADAPALDMCGTARCADVAAATPAGLPPAPAAGPDLVANALAGIVLAGLVSALGYSVVATLRGGKPADPASKMASRKKRRNPRNQVRPTPGWQHGGVPLLALFGLGVAAYLAYTKLADTSVVCGPVGDCDAVQTSVYSELLGVPVAVLGALNYLGILGLWAASRLAKRQAADVARLGLFGLALVGALFSLYLTFLEPFVIGAVCAWCLASAVTMTFTLLLATRLTVQETLMGMAAGQEVG
jgi:uncharacterized membrane protein